jgi:hypothetical protein
MAIVLIRAKDVPRPGILNDPYDFKEVLVMERVS